VTAGRFRADRVYLGWQHALVHPEPGPRPRRPVPPDQEQLNPGWVAAQRREENLLNRPLRLTIAGCAALAALLVTLVVTGILNVALTSFGLAVAVALAAMSGRRIRRSEQDLREAIGQEERRVARARSAQEKQLFGWQDEHARRARDWQARERAFAGQLLWYAVALPDEIDRVDVAGGTLSGWSAMLTMIAAPRLAAGGEVTVLDLSEGAVAQDLLAVARGSGIDPLVWVLPADLPRFELGVGLPGPALADVLAISVAPGGDQAQAADAASDYAILGRILDAIGGNAALAQVTAGLRALAQVGDPREDIDRGLITAAQLEKITGRYGRGAADRVVIERAWALEARLAALENLGSDPVSRPESRLRVIAMDRAAGVAGNAVLGTYVAAALTHVLRQAPPGQPWRRTLCLTGAEKLRGDVLDRLCDACEVTRTGLVLAYRSLPAHVRERLGRGNAAVAFMRLGNAEDAKVASEQIGTEHRFELTQLTDTVGTSVTGTVGDSYTSTFGVADSVSVSASTSETTARSRGSGHSAAGLGPFGQYTGSASRDSSRSWATSDTESITEGINLSSAWGVSTSEAIGANSSLARTTQRSREFLVEQHELQQLPPSAMIVSYASPSGRRLVMADANPGILTLPAATLHGLDELRDAAPMAAEPAQAGVFLPGGYGGAGDYGDAGGYGDAGDGGGGWDNGDTQASAALGGPGGRDPAAAPRPGPAVPPESRPVPPGARAAPVSWRDAEDKLPPNLGPPPEPLDWRKRRK
jgi:hypothetical protein